MVGRIRATAAAVVLLAAAAGPALAAPAADPVDLGGADLPGGEASTDPGSPTELDAGLWADTLMPGDSPHQFSYTRTMRDSTVHLGVVAQPLDADGDGVALAALDAADGSCGSDEASSSFPIATAVVGASVDVGPSEPGVRDETCVSSETVVFTVDRSTSSGNDTELPLAIKIVEEAPSDSGAEDLPSPVPSAEGKPPAAGSEEDAEGGTSFDDAPELAAGTTYRLSLPQGGQRLFRVRLGWGQSLDVRAEIPPQDAEAEEILEFTSPEVALSLVDPMRNVVMGLLDDNVVSGTYGDDPTILSDGVPPLRYLSRFDEPLASLPGDYWVVVAVAEPDEGRAVDVPVLVSAEVRGEEEGSPTYAETVQGPGGSAGPDGYAPDTPFLVGEDDFSADPSGNPPPRAGDSGDAADVTVRRIGGAALLVVSLGLCLAGALRLRRRPV